jgi:hypothetical protein
MKMELTACYCDFKREKGDEWEEGLAIATSHGSSDVIAIFPVESTTRADALPDVHDFRLNWTMSLYPPAR